MNWYLRVWVIIGLVCGYPTVTVWASGYWLEREGYMYTSNIIDPKLMLQRGYESVSSKDNRGYLYNNRLEDMRFLDAPISFNRLRLIPLPPSEEELKKQKEQEEAEKAAQQAEPPPEPEKPKVSKQPDPYVVSSGVYPRNMPILMMPPKNKDEEKDKADEDTALPQDIMGIFHQERTLPSGKKNSIYVPFQAPQNYDENSRNSFPARATYIRE